MRYARSSELFAAADASNSPAPTDAGPEQRRVAPRWTIESRGDLAAIGVLLGLIAIKAWERIRYPEWLDRVDILNQYLLWWSYLGQQLRAGDIPGWNPYSFGGTPFLGDPQSGWMYVPAMVPFLLFSPIAAIKAYVVVELLIGGLSTYAFARVLSFSPLPSLAAAIAYTFGPFLEHNTYCCNIQGHVAAWIPLGLLGVELGVRAASRHRRLVGWSICGLAISQMVAGWIGQGTYYGVLLVGSYLTYRLLFSATPRPRFAARIRWLIVHGAAIVVIGGALSAAALLPRLDINQETNLANGYSPVEGQEESKGTDIDGILARMLAPDFKHRRTTVGAATLALALVGAVIAWRRAPVPYFVIQPLVVLVLTLKTTPLHRLVYLIPGLQELHEHAPSRILGVLMIGPAMLTAAAIEAIPRLSIRQAIVAALVPLGGLVLMTGGLEERHRNLESIGLWTIVAFVGVALAYTAVLLSQRRPPRWRWIAHARCWVPLLLIIALVCEPSGRDLIAQLRHSPVDDHTLEVVASNMATDDSDSAGEFLQGLKAASAAPFRYIGYNAINLRTEANPDGIVYQNRLFSPRYRRLLIGPRSMVLRLYHLQGYNPVQLQRTVDLFQTINGQELEYHDAYVLPQGMASPWIDVMTVKYFIVPPTIPPDRPDLLHLSQQNRTVFANGRIRVLENADVLPYSWIVHDVRLECAARALELVQSGTVDPLGTALLTPDTAQPALSAPSSSADESVVVERYEPDDIVINARLAADGMVVLAEIYDPGWQAYVDGVPVTTYLVDGALRGVSVPSGDHRIELRYAPRSIWAGMAISGATALVLLGGIVGIGRRPKRISLVGKLRPLRTKGNHSSSAPVHDPSRSQTLELQCGVTRLNSDWATARVGPHAQYDENSPYGS